MSSQLRAAAFLLGTWWGLFVVCGVCLLFCFYGSGGLHCVATTPLFLLFFLFGFFVVCVVFWWVFFSSVVWGQLGFLGVLFGVLLVFFCLVLLGGFCLFFK